MKKKLLSILLSVFVIATAFTTNVHAGSINTVGNVLDTNSDFPSADISAWCNENNGGIYNGFGYLRIFEYGNISNYISLDINSSVVPDGTNFKYEDTGNNYKIVFNMEDGALKTISVEVTGNEALTGTYIDTLSVSEALGKAETTFPTTKETGWTNGNAYLYLGQDAPGGVPMDHLFIYDGTLDDSILNGLISLNPNNTDAYLGLFTFNFDSSGNLTSITVSGFESYGAEYSHLDGTYTAPVTIADLLPDDFPTTKETGWKNDNGVYIFKDTIVGDILICYIESDGEYPFIEVDAILTGENEITNPSSQTITFNISNNKLVSFTVSNFGAPLDGTYYPQNSGSGSGSSYTPPVTGIE